MLQLGIPYIYNQNSYVHVYVFRPIYMYVQHRLTFFEKPSSNAVHMCVRYHYKLN